MIASKSTWFLIHSTPYPRGCTCLLAKAHQHIWSETFQLQGGLNATSLRSSSLGQESGLKTLGPPCSLKPSSIQPSSWPGLFVLLWAGTQAGVEGWAGWPSHVLLSSSSEVDTEALTMEVRRRRDQAVPNCGFSFHLPDYLLPCAGVQFALIVALVLRVTIKPIWASPPAVFYCLTIICLL